MVFCVVINLFTKQLFLNDLSIRDKGRQDTMVAQGRDTAMGVEESFSGVTFRLSHKGRSRSEPGVREGCERAIQCSK